MTHIFLSIKLDAFFFISVFILQGPWISNLVTILINPQPNLSSGEEHRHHQYPRGGADDLPVSAADLVGFGPELVSEGDSAVVASRGVIRTVLTAMLA